MKTVLDLDDERLAVLFAIKEAGQYSATPHQIFERLPKTLKQRWSEKYLIHAVLHELIASGFAEIRQVGPGQHQYALTNKGRLEV